MSPQRRTFPPRATGRPSGDDEYPTDTFESVADRTDYDDEPSRAEPTLGSVAASDDDPPTQVFGVISDAAEPPAVAVQLFGEYSGSDDEHDTGVIARVRDDDTDLGVAGPSAAKFRARATASDDAHTEQFAAYRDENEVASQARAAAPATRTSPGLPPVSVPPVPPNATVGLVLPLDTSEQETSEHAPETTPAADETLAPEPVMDKKAAEHAAKDQKAAAREAAKAERLAARAERKAERLAARAERKAAKRPADAATGPDVEAGMDAAPATEDAAAVDTTDPADPDASD
nr:hypothetical protein [Pseudonocardiales bacterium]